MITESFNPAGITDDPLKRTLAERVVELANAFQTDGNVESFPVNIDTFYNMFKVDTYKYSFTNVSNVCMILKQLTWICRLGKHTCKPDVLIELMLGMFDGSKNIVNEIISYNSIISELTMHELMLILNKQMELFYSPSSWRVFHVLYVKYADNVDNAPILDRIIRKNDAGDFKFNWLASSAALYDDFTSYDEFVRIVDSVEGNIIGRTVNDFNNRTGGDDGLDKKNFMYAVSYIDPVQWNPTKSDIICMIPKLRAIMEDEENDCLYYVLNDNLQYLRIENDDILTYAGMRILCCLIRYHKAMGAECFMYDWMHYLGDAWRNLITGAFNDNNVLSMMITGEADEMPDEYMIELIEISRQQAEPDD